MSEIEESDDAPSSDHLVELKLYLEAPREYQESLRNRSRTFSSCRAESNSNERSNGIKVNYHNNL